ncbi:MAG TPA: acyltransferase family protein [Ferruginibacter sp.]|nr:acyltransferase family protein [Ferruginibacter sp.]
MNYIRGFNGLRAFSVFFVVSTHIGLYEFLLKRGFYHPNLDVLFSGNTGVQVFFTLSGFLITLILLKEYNKKGSISLKNFYIRRFLRLLPPLIILLCLVSIFMFLKLIPVHFWD